MSKVPDQCSSCGGFGGRGHKCPTGKRGTGSVPMIVHCGDPPNERIECVVQLSATGEWLVATWVPEVQRWRFPYEEPLTEAPASAVVMWADLREIFCASVAKQPTPNTEKMMQSPIDSMIYKACGYEPEECRPDPTDLAQQVASNVMHHIHTMYPAMIEAAPKTAQVSVRNTILREVEKALSFYA